MPITDEDKMDLASALDFCWLRNLNNQIKCQEIFQTLNRLWNNLNGRINTSVEGSDDSVKFRRFLKEALPSELMDKLSSNSCFDAIYETRPLIHNDSVVTSFQGRVFSEHQSSNLPPELEAAATLEHKEFNKYLDEIRNNPNSKNRREFRNKLCRLLYVVRSNIAHGSKANYEGSERNEKICKAIYAVLIQLCNEILDNGLYRVCAYGELRKDGKLSDPLVTHNNGIYVHDATINGQLISSDNTLLFDPSAEYSTVDVQIVEFVDFDSLYRIDNVECMPRLFKPYFEGRLLKGFGWVYVNTFHLNNISGPRIPIERRISNISKTRAFLFSLKGIDAQFFARNNYGVSDEIQMFGGLTIKSGNQIQYSQNSEGSLFILPNAEALISFVNDIGNAYRAIFEQPGDLLPFSSCLDLAVQNTKFHNEAAFAGQGYPAENEVNTAILRDVAKAVVEQTAIWASNMVGDEDGDMWIEINSN